MVRICLYVRSTNQDYQWTQHFVLLPRIPLIGDHLAEEENAPWYRVESVLRLPQEDEGDEYAWEAVVYAVEVAPEPARRNGESALRATSHKTGQPEPPPADGSEKRRRHPHSWKGYALALLVVGIALTANLVVRHTLESNALFILFILSVVVASASGGIGSGLFATLLASGAVLFFFIEPFYTLSIAQSYDTFRLVGFTLCALAAIAAAHWVKGFYPRQTLC